MYNIYKIPCAEVGRRYGFDHTSVLHADKLIKDLLSIEDYQVTEWIKKITSATRTSAAKTH